MLAAALWLLRFLMASILALAGTLFFAFAMALNNVPIGAWLFVLILLSLLWLIKWALDTQAKGRN